MSDKPRMNASERQALRQVVRQRMKVLRSDVAARKAELVAEIEDRVSEQYADRDAALREANDKAEDLIRTATIGLRTLISELEIKLGLGPNTVKLANWPGMPIIGLMVNDKASMRRRLYAEVEAQVSAALVDIDRREADLIEEITVDGLETDAARDFLTRIPTVGQLVPTTRIREITA